MKVIKVADIDTNKTVKKTLIHRSHPNLLNSMKNRLGPNTDKSLVSSESRNYTGLKNMHLDINAETQGKSAIKMNNDYWDSKLNMEHKCGDPGKVVNSNNNINQHKHKVESNSKSHSIMDSKQVRLKRSSSTIDQTATNSKFSLFSKNQNITKESQYFSSEYFSPRQKLRKLERERYQKKKKWLKELKQVVSTNERISQNRFKNKLQIQIYKQIINNLKRQNGSEKVYQNHLECIASSKKSGSQETEEGQSSKQQLSLSLQSSVSSC